MTDSIVFWGDTGSPSPNTSSIVFWGDTGSDPGSGSAPGENFTVRYQVAPVISPELIQDYIAGYVNLDTTNDGARDDGVVINTNDTRTINVTENDTILFDELVINQPAQKGTAAVSGNNIVYAPKPGFIGVDVVGYTLMRNFNVVGTADLWIGVVSGDVVVDNGATAAADYLFPVFDSLDCNTAKEFRDRLNEISAIFNQFEKVSGGKIILRDSDNG